MNKSLQKHVLKKYMEKRGVASDLIDVEAELDANVRLDENLSNGLGQRINMLREHDEDYWCEKAESLYHGLDIHKIIFWRWMRWKWRHPKSNTTLEQFMFS